MAAPPDSKRPRISERTKSSIRVCGCRISNFREIPPTKSQESPVTRRFLAAGDFCKRARVRFDGFRNSLAVNKLSFAAAGDQSGFAQNLQMVRDGCRSDPAHRDDLSAVHVLGCRDGLENLEAGLVGESFRYFFNLRAVHGPARSVTDLRPFSPQRAAARKIPPRKMQPITSIVI